VATSSMQTSSTDSESTAGRPTSAAQAQSQSVGPHPGLSEAAFKRVTGENPPSAVELEKVVECSVRAMKCSLRCLGKAVTAVADQQYVPLGTSSTCRSAQVTFLLSLWYRVFYRPINVQLCSFGIDRKLTCRPIESAAWGNCPLALPCVLLVCHSP